MIDTNVTYTKDDLGKNLYRKKTYYTLVVEQEVLADNKDEADQMFIDNGGIDHSQINHEITEARNGVETYMVDANYSESDDTEYVGKVEYDLSDPYAKEEGYVEINTYADEVDIPEDVDTTLDMEIETERGR
jgi:flagellar basal body rod protein FlgC